MSFSVHYRYCTLKAPDFNRGDEKVLASKTQMQYIEAVL